MPPFICIAKTSILLQHCNYKFNFVSALCGRNRCKKRKYREFTEIDFNHVRFQLRILLLQSPTLLLKSLSYVLNPFSRVPSTPIPTGCFKTGGFKILGLKLPLGFCQVILVIKVYKACYCYTEILKVFVKCTLYCVEFAN